MKLREIRIQSFRNLAPGGDLRRIRFDDPATELVRPLSILVGSNGSGKSTLFQLVEGLLGYALEVMEDPPITRELREQGYAAIQRDCDRDAPDPLQDGLWIALGRKDRAPAGYQSLPNQICHLEQRGGKGKPLRRVGPQKELNEWGGKMMRGDAPLRDGLLYFPHNRWIEHQQRGAIEPPPPLRAGVELER